VVISRSAVSSPLNSAAHFNGGLEPAVGSVTRFAKAGSKGRATLLCGSFRPLADTGNAIPNLSQSFYIADPGLAAPHLDELHKRFQSEWPDYQPLAPTDRAVPAPVVALTLSGVLAGGLAFAGAKAPLSDERAIWINAVLVAPEYRRQGLGSQLIAAAERSAVQFGISRLYALTELPTLYSKLDWSILSNDGIDFVMARQLGASRQ